MDTRDILFVCGGAFEGLERIIARRIGHAAGVGFGKRAHGEKAESVMHEVASDDLLKYGLIPEFVGRLPVVAALDELDAEALVRIICEPKNALLRQFQKLFEMDGVELEITDDGLEAIARRSQETTPAPAACAHPRRPADGHHVHAALKDRRQEGGGQPRDRRLQQRPPSSSPNPATPKLKPNRPKKSA